MATPIETARRPRVDRRHGPAAVEALATTLESPVRIGVSLGPRRSARALALGALALVVLHVSVHVCHYRITAISPLIRGLVDLDDEQSFGTWYSSVLLLAGAASALACSRQQHPRPGVRRSWRWLAAGFLLLSAEEIAGVHEVVNAVTDFSWAIPGAFLALAAGAAFLPFLAQLPWRTRSHLLLAGLVYVGGAIGIELASARYAGLMDTLEYALATALEEGMEMGGAILFVFATLDYLAGGGAERPLG